MEKNSGALGSELTIGSTIKDNQLEHQFLTENGKQFLSNFPLFRSIHYDNNFYFRVFAFLYFENLISNVQLDKVLPTLINDLTKQVMNTRICDSQTLPPYLQAQYSKIEQFAASALQDMLKYYEASDEIQDIITYFINEINKKPLLSDALILYLRNQIYQRIAGSSENPNIIQYELAQLKDFRSAQTDHVINALCNEYRALIVVAEVKNETLELNQYLPRETQDYQYGVLIDGDKSGLCYHKSVLEKLQIASNSDYGLATNQINNSARLMKLGQEFPSQSRKFNSPPQNSLQNFQGERFNDNYQEQNNLQTSWKSVPLHTQFQPNQQEPEYVPPQMNSKFATKLSQPDTQVSLNEFIQVKAERDQLKLQAQAVQNQINQIHQGYQAQIKQLTEEVNQKKKAENPNVEQRCIICKFKMDFGSKSEICNECQTTVYKCIKCMQCDNNLIEIKLQELIRGDYLTICPTCKANAEKNLQPIVQQQFIQKPQSQQPITQIQGQVYYVQSQPIQPQFFQQIQPNARRY